MHGDRLGKPVSDPGKDSLLANFTFSA
jgi:hypothetical protein